MGAFNTVRLSWHNPQSGEAVDVTVQFKYGDTWQYEYNIGDVLRWGGNDNGIKDARRVVVDGALEGDIPGVPEDFEVYIVDGRIDMVIPATGEHDFVKSRDTYIVLDE